MLSNLKAIFVIFLAILLVSFSLGQTTPASGQTTSASDSNYKIRAEDTITITTQDTPEVTGDYAVRRDGYISLAYVGDVKVAGLTAAELETQLTQLLKKQLVNPHVTVNLKQTTPERIYIIGQVRDQGFVDWKPKWRLTEALAAAGGLTSQPERSRVTIFRTGMDHKTVNLRQLLVLQDDSQNLPVEPGDVLNVLSDETVRLQVVGEVKKPGITEVIAGEGIAEALAEAGGQDQLSRLSGAKLVRAGQQIPIDLYGAVIKGEPEKNTLVQEIDTLYVPTLLTRVSVIGSVVKPGPILISDGRDETLSSAITLAGGFAPNALRDHVNIYSKGPDGKEVHKTYNMKKMVVNAKTGPIDPVLQDGDIVFVAESGKANSAENVGLFFGAFNVFRYLFP
jgi:protein involved in polysaccharide export with SLBB domain